MKSGSLWPAVIWHGAHNLLILAVYLSMTTRTEYCDYVVSDLAGGVMLTGILLAIINFRRN